MTPPETTPSPTEQFAEILTSLADFKEYFTDDARIEELVSWVHEETNLNKIAIRSAIKVVAFLLKKVAAKAGAPVASAWLKKVHDRLSNQQWYFQISQKLLNTLKSRTDKTLEQAFTIPATANLEALITDQARWENLKPEQQGLVQLLLGQNQISEAQDISRQQLNQQFNQLLDLFSFQLDLKTPEAIIAGAKDAQYGSAHWLTYARRQAALVGREGDLRRLADFLDQEAEVSWWVICGAGGIGKSRLALEFLLLHQNLWEVGFLSKDRLCDRAGLDRWRPLCPTLMVIDYAAEYPDDIGQWLDHLIRHQQEYDFPVRLLILERHYQGQEWWKKLVPATTDGLARKQKLYTQTPLELGLLTRAQQREALQGFLGGARQPCELPAEDGTFWESLHALSDKGRPLFIGMVAVALAMGGNSVNAIRNWTTSEDLLQYVLGHEQLAWARQLASGKYTDQEQKRIFDLLAISTVAAGLEWERNEEAIARILLASGLCTDSAELFRFWQAVCLLTGNGAGTLQPDIFAEYFVLHRWQAQPNQPVQHIRQRLSAAHRLAPASTRSFIARCATDYPQEESVRIWWDWLREGSSSADATGLIETAFAITSQLRLQGQSRLALAVWLPPLLSLADPRLRARALNLQGALHHSLGKFAAALPPWQEALAIWQEIGDRRGEGATLNNMGTLSQARGDYDTALDYLEQSLTIQQEIGDRRGEGTTRNNISQIYDARGDYDTALDYLRQSLTIWQEIGDRSGEGTTRNNISQIYDARGDYDTALDYLRQALTIWQEIGDRSGEGTTLNNISQIYDARGDYATALDYLRQALTICQEIGDRSGEGATLNNISQIYDARGDYATALGYLRQSLTIRQEIGDRKGEGETLNSMGALSQARGDFVTALGYLEQSLVIRREIGDRSGFCATLFNIGHIHRHNKEPQEAMRCWATVYQTAREIGEAQALTALAALAERLDLPGGLDGWERVAQKMKLEGASHAP